MPRDRLIQFRYGTAAAWTTANPVLVSGEPGYESDTGKFKIGDGVSAWSALDYFVVQTAVPEGSVDHGALTGLTDDDHSQYPLLAGRSGAPAVTNAEFSRLAGVTSAIQTQLDSKAASSHTHTGVYDPAGTAASAIATHEAASDPHTGYQKESEKGGASGYASLDGSTKVPVAQLPDATTSAKGVVELATDGESASGVVVQGNDSRLANARTPSAHAVESAGGFHTASGLTTGHVLRATGASTFAFAAIQDGDIPSSIARDSEVTSAISTHEGASDPHPGYLTEVAAALALADKQDASVLLDGIIAAGSALSSQVLGALSADTPAWLTATQLTALINSYTGSLKGLVPAGSGGTTNFLREDGSWAAPPGGGGGGLTVPQAMAIASLRP